MNEYHKIQTCFKRDENTKQILEGAWTLPEFEYLKDRPWVFTEKVDGTNVRVMWDGTSVVFGGKTDNASMPMFLLSRLQEIFEGTAKRRLFASKFFNDVEPTKVCLYGEGYGAKIQSGGNYIPDGQDFVLFDVKIGDMWLERENVVNIAETFGIKVVPVLGEGTLTEAIEMTRNGFNSVWGDFQAEGIVARPKVELRTRRGDRIITKIKHRDFK